MTILQWGCCAMVSNEHLVVCLWVVLIIKRAGIAEFVSFVENNVLTLFGGWCKEGAFGFGILQGMMTGLGKGMFVLKQKFVVSVQVKLGGDQKKSGVCRDGGVTPVWDETLTL